MDLSSLPNNLETITLNQQTNYRLIEICKIKDYFGQEIKYQQELTSKLSKHLTCFNYTDKILTVFFNCFFWKKTITWFDYICFFFKILFKFWNT